MKFGQKFNETLAGLSPEMRAGAIEYRKLKKVIKRVASELSELGLTSEVLKDLLESNQTAHPPPALSELSPEEAKRAIDVTRGGVSSHANGSANGNGAAGGSGGAKADADSSEDEDEHIDNNYYDPEKKREKRTRKRRAHATYEFTGTHENPEPRIRIVFSSASSESVSDSSSPGGLLHPDSQSSDTSTISDLPTPTSTRDHSPQPHARITELRDSDSSDAGSPRMGSTSGDGQDDGMSQSEVTDSRKLEFEGAGPQANSLLRKMYGVGKGSDVSEGEDEHDWHAMGVEVDPHSTTSASAKGKERERRRSDETLRREEIADEMEEMSLEGKRRQMEETVRERQAVEDAIVSSEGAEADDEAPPSLRPPRRRKHRHRTHKKEVFIPLNSDTEFLTLLAQAFSSLAALQLAQKKAFTQSVELLAREVSKVSSPSRPKTDLYVWREIFALWVEAQVFESAREKDRGERSTDAVEEKLDWFVGEVAKRKLANKMRHKESRVALEKFIKLNVELLDMKKFQLANEEAARKILKKHDKRTALTASLGFPQFISAASQLSGGTLDLSSPTGANGALTATNNNGNKNGGGGGVRVLTLPGLPSLPHVLLSTFTSTLLPIIPQVEDYECAICGDVAFKPIKLDCGHKFCVRCLIKMQKRGQDNCPHCRQAVVLRASGANLDRAMQDYLKLWFPREVKAKEKGNKKEAAQEELEEMGLNPNHKCVVQ